MFDRLPVFEAKHFEGGAQAGEIVEVVGKGKIAVLEHPAERDLGRGSGQPREQGGNTFAALVGLGVVLYVLVFVHNRRRHGVAGFDAFEKLAQKIFFRRHAVNPAR